MATAGDGSAPYEGGGAGGKFRKRPFRRSIPATPYARPPAAVRNDNPSMLKKLVDPASRLISSGAHRLFDVFRKHLPSRSLGPPEINEEPQNVLQKEGGNGNSASTSAATGISDLEQVLQQKTFTRSEIERLTSVLHSKSTESPFDNSLEKQGDKKDNFHAAISTPVVTSGVFKETASPDELAKYYMGSRSTSQAPRQDSKLHPRTPTTTVAQKTSNSLATPENGFGTPRSRGRSAMYTMARTPYSRSSLNFSQQGTKSDYGHDAALTSSQGHERKMALKRRSSVLDDDIGSGGPLRRIRQKANLLSQREKKELGYTAFQQVDGSGQNLLLTDKPEPKVSNYALVPTKATQTANKILQHLDKPSSLEKNSPSTFSGTKEKTPNKLRLDMLHGQALRSLEEVGSPKLDPIVHDIQKPEVSELTFESKDKTEEDGLRKSHMPHKMLTLVNGDVADTSKNKAPVVEIIDLPSRVIEEPQKKHAFQMSAPEDMFEIDDEDDDVHDNGHVSFPLVENNKLETSVADIIKAPTLLEVSKTPELVKHNKPLFPEVYKVPDKVELKEAVNGISTPSSKTDFGFSGGSVISSSTSPLVTTTQTSVLTNSALISANEVSEFKPNAGSDPKEIAPISVFNSVTKNDNIKVSVSNKDENGTSTGNDQKSTNMVGKSESLSPAVSAATSADGIFSFGTSTKTLSTPDTTPASSPPTFPSLAPFSASAGTATIMTTISATTTMAALSTTTTTPVVTFSTSVSPQVFSFGTATSSAPSTSVAESGNTSSSSSSPFAITTFATTTATGSGLFGLSSAAAATSTTTTGSGFFGFSSPASTTPTTTTTTTGNGLFGFSSATTATSTTPITTTTTGNGLFGFSSAATATSTTTTTAATGNGLFGFSAPAEATSTTTGSGLFGFSSPAAATLTTTTTGSGLFGFSSSSATTSTTGTATTTATVGSGLFGFSSPAAATSTTTTGGGLFGLSSPAGANSTTTSTTSTGSGLFGFSSPAVATSNTDTTTGSGLFGFSSPAAATTTTATSTTGSGLFTFGSSTAAPSTTSSQSQGSFFNVNNGFQTSNHASSTSTLFGSSAPAFGSTPNSGNSTSGPTTSIFGSSWQQPQTSGFGSTFTSSPSTSVFSFGASSTPTPSFGGPSVFGNSTPVFGAVAATAPNNNNISNNNSDQMSMEDSMAEDSMQTHSPVSPFGQAPVSTPGFMFGSTTPNPNPAPVSFSFGGQQNQAPTPQNPFQSSSVEFNAGGGSFSLGSGGEKSNRRIVRVMKSKNRKK